MYGPSVEQEFAFKQFERDRLVKQLTRYAQFESTGIDTGETPECSRFERLKDAVNRAFSPPRLQRRTAAQ